jgi:hypothetical protein
LYDGIIEIIGAEIKMEKKVENYLRDSGAMDILDYNHPLQAKIDRSINEYKVLLPESNEPGDIFIEFQHGKDRDDIKYKNLFLFSKDYLVIFPNFFESNEVLFQVYPIKNRITFLEVLKNHNGYQRISLSLSEKSEIIIKAESMNCKCLKRIYSLYLKSNLIV